jgi:hypothetical protein
MRCGYKILEASGENVQTSYILGFVKFFICLFMTEGMLTGNGVLVLQSSRNALKVVGLV